MNVIMFNIVLISHPKWGGNISKQSFNSRHAAFYMYRLVYFDSVHHISPTLFLTYLNDLLKSSSRDCL